MKKNEKIEAYLTKTMPLEDRASFKPLIQSDSILKNQMRVKGLEILVTQALNLQRGVADKSSLAKWRKEFKRRKVIRNLSFLAMAASFALLLIIGNHFTTTTNTSPVFAKNWEQADFNTKSFLPMSTNTQEIIGKWQTTIQEENGTGILIHLACLPENIFTISVTFLSKNTLGTKDRVDAVGIYNLDAKRIKFQLDPNSINRKPANTNLVHQLQTGAMEQWLKKENNRLFKESLEISRLDAEKLFLQYAAGNGLTWEK